MSTTLLQMVSNVSPNVSQWHSTFLIRIEQLTMGGVNYRGDIEGALFDLFV